LSVGFLAQPLNNNAFSMNKTDILNFQGVEIFVISDFLSNEECLHLCHLIENNNQRSTVVPDKEGNGLISDYRTSQSCFFQKNDAFIDAIDLRIGETIGIPITYAEPMQGQLYNVGEFFNDHHDYFSEGSNMKYHGVSGQRTWTVMVYLNDVEEGGYTEFPMLGKSFAPIKGSAVFWKNSDGKGTENDATLHSGRPVVKGKKMIITKWFRENLYLPNEDSKIPEIRTKSGLYEVKGINDETRKVQIDYVKGIPHARYNSNDKIPALTIEGFKKTKIPLKLFKEIANFYKKEKGKSKPEFDPKGEENGLGAYIWSDKVAFPTEMVNLTRDLEVSIFETLKPIIQKWSGDRIIENTFCYGIRTYYNGAVLKKHTDGFETRILSVILNIDQKVNEHWPLQIDDHQGIEHEVFLKPGEMILYESAILEHGRVKPFDGEYFSNVFVHYVNLS
jgi:prolyl 4-hydroxylase